MGIFRQPPQPIVGTKLAPSNLPPPDNPPVVSQAGLLARIVAAWATPPAPELPPKIAAITAAGPVAPDNPPVTSPANLLAIVGRWWAVPPLPELPPKIAAAIAAGPAAPDNPPVTSLAGFYGQVMTWWAPKPVAQAVREQVAAIAGATTGVTYTQLERSIRGLNRGLATGMN